MSKDKNTAAESNSPMSATSAPELKENIGKKKRIAALFSSTWFIVTSIVAAILIVATVIIAITMSTQNITLREVFGLGYKRIDYINDSLDKYIKPDAEDYRGVELELNVPRPDDGDVDEVILGKLAAAAKDAGKVSIYYEYNTPVSAGDVIYFCYAAYLLDENGNRIEELRDLNSCADYNPNDDSTLREFTVGSGDFAFLDGIDYELDSTLKTVYSDLYIRGFEKGLIGATPSGFTFHTMGNVEMGDIVYATASYVDGAGLLHDDINIRIDLSDANYEAIWGEGIFEYLTEKQIGDPNTEPMKLTCTGSGEKLTFTSLVVNYVSDDESGAHRIVTTFPYDHPDKRLQNATVGFDIFIKKTVDYNTPVFNDAFVTDYLKLSDKALPGTQDTPLTDRCRAYYMEQLVATYKINRSVLAEELLWEKLKENVEIRNLPEREIIAVYQDHLFEKKLELELENASGAGFENIDDFMEAEFGLEVGGDWENILYSMAEDEVIEKLIFYSVLKKEGKLQDGPEFDAFCRAELEGEYLQRNGKTATDFESAEKYDEEIAALRAELVVRCGGEASFIEEMYYRYGSSILLGYAVLNDTVS